ncbi:hypothetical protein [Rhodobium gokarnense]|uniref:Uncharacterized protein n=1 Tax=Rhodobium gokarnense TaxID=364296 RepID=A0ABT3H9Z9_9HYPH|nr:hypothetical protein [Rhodobium gokarnense]MCW2307209.1 hypothetical protein [Rhodobium gokarnense]
MGGDTTYRFARAAGLAVFCLMSAAGARAAGSGPDPAVVDFRVSDVRADGSGRLDFEIACRVQNLGDAAFASTRRGQGIALYEIRHGESEGHRLRYRRFSDLDAGEELKLHKWIKDWAVDEAFPSSFECKLVYDVEKRSDQDSRNDDADLTNNRGIVRGIDILKRLKEQGPAAD